jgi:hypothetical protein
VHTRRKVAQASQTRPNLGRRMEKCVDEHMAAAAANQNNSTFTCRIVVPGCEDSQSQAAALVFCQSTQCQPKHVTERLESPTPHREIILPCGTPHHDHNLLPPFISNTGPETTTYYIHAPSLHRLAINPRSAAIRKFWLLSQTQRRHSRTWKTYNSVRARPPSSTLAMIRPNWRSHKSPSMT